MNKMSKKVKNCGCGSKNSDPVMNCSRTLSDPSNASRNRFLFPTDIKKLLILVAEDEGDNRVDIILDACSNHCLIEDARVIAVTDNTVIIKEGNGCDSKFRYVCIGCICEVIVDCDTILQELFEEHSYNRE
jgi:hypothetical protein